MLSGTAKKKKGMAEGLEGEGETSTKWEVQRGAWGAGQRPRPGHWGWWSHRVSDQRAGQVNQQYSVKGTQEGRQREGENGPSFPA